MTIEIYVTSNAYFKIKQFAKKINSEIYNIINDNYVIVMIEDIRDVSSVMPTTNYLTFSGHDEIFELLKDMSDDVITLYFNGILDTNYDILHNKILSNFQNINSIYTGKRDIMSVENNKMLFYSNVYKIPNLLTAESSLKLLFTNTNLELIEYATIAVNFIIKDGYYHRLKWIGKMCNLKRLNLILMFQKNSDVEQFINEINIPVNLKTFIIKSVNLIDSSKLKIPFGIDFVNIMI